MLLAVTYKCNSELPTNSFQRHKEIALKQTHRRHNHGRTIHRFVKPAGTGHRSQ